MTLAASIQADTPASLTLTDQDGHTVTVTGPAPEAARTRALEAEAVAAQLSKTGGTPYRVEAYQVEVGPGPSLPRSALNALRREAVDRRKRERLRTAAEADLSEHGLEDGPARFDVAEIYSDPGHRSLRLEYLENAFTE